MEIEVQYYGEFTWEVRYCYCWLLAVEVRSYYLVELAYILVLSAFDTSCNVVFGGCSDYNLEFDFGLNLLLPDLIDIFII